MNIRLRVLVWRLCNIFNSHINIGKHITVFGNNAMHWGVTIRTKRYGYICFRLPLRSCGGWWPLYLYCSPNGTPWAATFMLGHGHDNDWMLSRVRRKVLWHNFDMDGCTLFCGTFDDQKIPVNNRHILRAINDSIGSNMHSYYDKALNYALEEETQCTAITV